MKTSAEFNFNTRDYYRRLSEMLNSPRPNEIECPKCQAELYDSDPNTTLTSNPPRKTVVCLKCNFQGYRVA